MCEFNHWDVAFSCNSRCHKTNSETIYNIQSCSAREIVCCNNTIQVHIHVDDVGHVGH